MASQQCRYVVVMIIVLLTIFIYVIYSTNEMEVPGRIHTSAPMSSIPGYGISDAFIGQEIRNNLTGNGTSNLNSNSSRNNNNNNSDNIRIVLEESKRHVPDTINNTSILHQYSDNLPSDINNNNNNELLNKSHNSQKSSNIVEEIPAKIEIIKLPNDSGASKSNKITSKSTSKTTTTITNVANNNNNKDNNNKINNNKDSSSSNVINNHTTTNTTSAPVLSGPLDTSKGIRTSEIYESGHIESNSEICPEQGGPVRLLILITSAPTHRDARLAIRQTWGHFGTRRDVAVGFMLGATGNPALEDQLDAENYMYGDLIRGHFIDSYNNLTLKTISLLEWVDKYCSKVSFVLKTDDDMFINVPKLLGFVEKHHKDTRTIYGRLAKKWKPIRNKKSKYYVSVKQYFPAVFPQFTTGPAYLMTADCIKDLYEKSLNQTYLKLEDVYTTGIVAHLSNIKRVHVIEFLNRRIAFNPCNIKKAISVHMVKSNEQFDLWKKLLDTNNKCK